jgi:hypothetical protein
MAKPLTAADIKVKAASETALAESCLAGPRSYRICLV